VLNYEPLQPYIWGGKGVGSQGDGSAQFVARSKADQRAAADLIEKELGMPALKLTLGGVDRADPFSTDSQDGGSGITVRAWPRVRKAVIPAAGLGTRLFPATKATKKEWFPIIDRDGVAKPAIFLIVEEALNAGIEEVIIIVQPEDLKDFRALFTSRTPAASYDKLPGYLQAYAGHILDMGRRVSFVEQRTQEGFGHAVYGTREAVGNEPFLLMLGDHLYRSNTDRTCARQLLDTYHQNGLSVLGLRPTPERDIGSYGTAVGDWLVENRLLTITEIAEKPTMEYAREHLRMAQMAEDEYLTLFGLYVLKPQIYELLEENIARNLREGGEFQLTTALDRLREQDGFLGLLVDGKAYDIGLPDAYIQALQHLRRG
jgi:UTP-glucose-1-phosphate uridylyltransferase